MQLAYSMGWLSCNRTSKLLVSRITLQGDDFCIFKNWNKLFHLLDCTVIKAGSAQDTSALASADFDRDLLMLHLLWNLHQKPGYHQSLLKLLWSYAKPEGKAKPTMVN